MTLVTGLATYFIVWWLVLFTVLPFGARSHHEADARVEPGNAPSAPLKPRILFKFAITTIISAAVFALLYAVIEYRLIDFDSILFLPTFER